MSSVRVYFCQNAPIIKEIGELFHVTYDVGGKLIEIVLPPSAYIPAVREAQKVSAAFHAGAADVVPFRRKRSVPAH